jgi:Mg-chelatase subunit ChlD
MRLLQTKTIPSVNRRINIQWFFALVFGLAFSWHSLAEEVQATPEKRSDVRVLIDISGSMKKNDPANLRVPALRIITNLMPKGSKSGVWTFGRYVNMLVPIKEVDENWQKQANEAAAKINSAGLFTNIGDAMAKSTWDWNRSAENESRSLILLTDGMVDISKDASVNEKERRRILDDILPRLKASGVTIHTIALSEEADKELLATLANQTDGWFQSVDNAEDLQRVFLKIFEQATPRDSLPLDNNQFKVDDSVEEMTLLVFRQPGSQPTQLITPTKQTLKSTTQDKNIRWFASKDYDLITINQPQSGEWRIDAAIDPDNRVLVVSKLGLSIDPLPNNVLVNEEIRYAVQLLEDGKAITRPDFLNLVEAKLETRYKGNRNVTPLLKDSSEGRFQQVFYAGNEGGVLEIKLVVKSPTFERSRTHAINIYGNPVQTDLELSFDENAPHKVHLRVTEDIVDLETLKVTGEIQYPDETSQFVVLDDWQQPVSCEVRQFPEGGKYRVLFKVEGKTPTGRKFVSDLPPVEFETDPLPGYGQPEETSVAEEPITPPEESPTTETSVVEEEVTDDNQTTEEISQSTEPPVEEPEPPLTENVAEPINWTLWISVGFVANLLLILLGWLVWRMIKKRSYASSEALAQELLEDDEPGENKTE